MKLMQESQLCSRQTYNASEAWNILNLRSHTRIYFCLLVNSNLLHFDWSFVAFIIVLDVSNCIFFIISFSFMKTVLSDSMTPAFRHSQFHTKMWARQIDLHYIKIYTHALSTTTSGFQIYFGCVNIYSMSSLADLSQTILSSSHSWKIKRFENI